MSDKRFKLSSETVLQYQIMDNDTDLNENEIIDLLNKLYKENEQLKSIKQFAENNGINIFDISTAFHKCWNDNAKLTKENEQLRQFINKGRRLSVKELMGNINENELLKKKIRGLEKENEYLKKRIEVISDELYCKDRKLEELGVPIECCDKR